MIFGDRLLNLSAVRETGSVYRYDSDPLYERTEAFGEKVNYPG